MFPPPNTLPVSLPPIYLPSGSMSLGMPRCVSAVANAFARFVVLVLVESEAMSMSSGRIVWIMALKACPFLQLRPKSFTSIPYFLPTNDYLLYIHKYGYNVYHDSWILYGIFLSHCAIFKWKKKILCIISELIFSCLNRFTKVTVQGRIVGFIWHILCWWTFCH